VSSERKDEGGLKKVKTGIRGAPRVLPCKRDTFHRDVKCRGWGGKLKQYKEELPIYCNRQTGRRCMGKPD